MIQYRHKKRKEMINMNTIRMFLTMIKGLFSYGEFKDKEDFWDWYWNEQIPDSRYPGESLWESFDTFMYIITFGPQRFEFELWWAKKFGKREFGYSWTFGKNGYFIKDRLWFVPEDGSFLHGRIDPMTEYRNGNLLFQ
jgi:hypothetical protein